MTLSKAELKKIAGRTKRSKYSDKQREDALRMFAGGATYREVSEACGVPLATLQNWVEAARRLAAEAK